MNKNIIIYFSFHGSATGGSIIVPPNVSLYFSCSHGESADDLDPLSEIFEGTFHGFLQIGVTKQYNKNY
jgi:hypothetical protein